jgi:hypothetical protein
VNLPTIKPEYKFIAGGILLLLAIVFAVNRATSWYDDYRHSKVVEDLKIERQKDIERGDFFETKATKAEGEKVTYQIALEIAGKDAQIAMEKVTNAEQKFNQEIESIGVAVPECERYSRLRAKLGLRPAPCETAGQ